MELRHWRRWSQAHATNDMRPARDKNNIVRRPKKGWTQQNEQLHQTGALSRRSSESNVFHVQVAEAKYWELFRDQHAPNPTFVTMTTNGFTSRYSCPAQRRCDWACSNYDCLQWSFWCFERADNSRTAFCTPWQSLWMQQPMYDHERNLSQTLPVCSMLAISALFSTFTTGALQTSGKISSSLWRDITVQNRTLNTRKNETENRRRKKKLWFGKR